MKYHLKIKNPVLALSLILIVCSCGMFETDHLITENPEVPLDISGNWQVINASRNGLDITDLMEFTKFRLNLNESGMYSIDNYLPFVTQETNGKWAIDDPVYPFRLFLYDTNGSNEIVALLNYPVIEGKRRIILTFSPGCGSNTYSYVFEKSGN